MRKITHNNCTKCGNSKLVSSTNCRTCSNIRRLTGSNNPNYVGGITLKKYTCKNCGGNVSLTSALYGSGLCKLCTSTKLPQKYCLDCNKKIDKRSERCVSCANSIIMKKVWENPEYRRHIVGIHNDPEFKSSRVKKTLRAVKNSPNKTELWIFDLLNSICPNLYEFTGYGKLAIEGFCPDFTDHRNKRIVEFFGNYWHSKKDVIARDIRKLEVYERNGYSVLVLSDDDLKDVNLLSEDIKRFVTL